MLNYYFATTVYLVSEQIASGVNRQNAMISTSSFQVCGFRVFGFQVFGSSKFIFQFHLD